MLVKHIEDIRPTTVEGTENNYLYKLHAEYSEVGFKFFIETTEQGLIRLRHQCAREVQKSSSILKWTWKNMGDMIDSAIFDADFNNLGPHYVLALYPWSEAGIDEFYKYYDLRAFSTVPRMLGPWYSDDNYRNWHYSSKFGRHYYRLINLSEIEYQCIEFIKEQVR